MTGSLLPDWARDPATLEVPIMLALEQHDVEGVVSALELLALVDPDRATEIRLIMLGGLAVAKERRRREGGTGQ